MTDPTGQDAAGGMAVSANATVPPAGGNAEYACSSEADPPSDMGALYRALMAEALRSIQRECEGHRYGQPGYDITLDHIYEVAAAAFCVDDPSPTLICAPCRDGQHDYCIITDGRPICPCPCWADTKAEIVKKLVSDGHAKEISE